MEQPKDEGFDPTCARYALLLSLVIWLPILGLVLAWHAGD